LAARIKRVINGPMIWSPDANVLFGPHLICLTTSVAAELSLANIWRHGIDGGAVDYRRAARADMFAWDIGTVSGRCEIHKARVGDRVCAPFQDHFPNEETRGRAAVGAFRV
jgi:dimethylglycine dehydrogenase